MASAKNFHGFKQKRASQSSDGLFKSTNGNFSIIFEINISRLATQMLGSLLNTPFKQFKIKKIKKKYFLLLNFYLIINIKEKKFKNNIIVQKK